MYLIIEYQCGCRISIIDQVFPHGHSGSDRWILQLPHIQVGIDPNVQLSKFQVGLGPNVQLCTKHIELSRQNKVFTLSDPWNVWAGESEEEIIADALKGRAQMLVKNGKPIGTKAWPF